MYVCVYECASVFSRLNMLITVYNYVFVYMDLLFTISGFTFEVYMLVYNLCRPIHVSVIKNRVNFTRELIVFTVHRTKYNNFSSS